MTGSNLANPPQSNEVEISVFGPGYGESVLVHLGLGDWIIVDSCIDQDSQLPAPIHYLHRIDVDPGTAVKGILASHWHDDHVRGLGTVFEECRAARFFCSTSLRTDEFLTLIHGLGKRAMMESSGIEEFFRIIQLLKERTQSRRQQSRGPEWAMADRRLWQRDNSSLPAEIYSLSPSPASITLAYNEIAELVPPRGQPKRRAVALRPNHVAVVLWIRIAGILMMLGSDLEETNDAGTGWSVIVGSATRPSGKACVFKIPHHGSATADHPRVWDEMLVAKPFAVLTPFVQGSVALPTKGDTRRICIRSPNAFATARPLLGRVRKRHGAVEKTIRETVRNIRVTTIPTGHVRIRRNLSKDDDAWSVELFNGALPLNQMHT